MWWGGVGWGWVEVRRGGAHQLRPSITMTHSSQVRITVLNQISDELINHWASVNKIYKGVNKGIGKVTVSLTPRRSSLRQYRRGADATECGNIGMEQKHTRTFHKVTQKVQTG